MKIPNATTVFLMPERSAPVLGECIFHGSFVVDSGELNAPCPRCRLDNLAPQLCETDDGFDRGYAFRREFVSLRYTARREAALKDTAGLRLSIANNEQCKRIRWDILDGIDAAIRWCDS